ncbi:hypothetical protein RUM44_002680 [Polyplax serrata]|uniref:Elongation factor 1-delta n=1 Tax=Polyplax serrata TaxID=468196 RepID=A0ABR1AFF5_POLSC
MAAHLACDKFWVNKNMYHDAEKKYYESLVKGDMGMTKLTEDSFPKTSLAGEVAKARQHLKSSLECMDQNINGMGGLSLTPLAAVLEKMETTIMNLTQRIEALEKKVASQSTTPAAKLAAPAPAKTQSKPAPKDDDDDDVDLFGSDSEEEDAEAKKIREQRLAEYAAKKSKKPAIVAKSNIILNVKPWDDNTDMKEMEKAVRAIEMDGLVWGASKLVSVAYTIYQLQISCVVEDDKVSVDALTETIEAIEDYVQSVDIAAFNKV